MADLDKKFKIFLKGEDKTNSVLSYHFIDHKCRVTFSNGKSFDYNKDNVKVIESCLNHQDANDCFLYLKELAREVGLTTEKDDGTIINFLEQNYSKIEFVDPDTIFAEFLGGKFLKRVDKGNNIFQDVIYPFGFNIGQKKAVDNALNNRLSIIEGPPGTGKTQTILNILGNIVLRGESVAVVSSNNSAVKNVFDKLKKSNLDFIVAFLGSRENKNYFIESQKSLPLMNEWKLSKEEVDELKINLRSKHEELSLKLNSKIKLSNLKQELTKVGIEQKHFNKFILKNEFALDSALMSKINNPLDALSGWLLCESQKIGIWLFAFVMYLFEILTGRESQRMLVHAGLKKYSCEQLIQMFQSQFYMLKIRELNKMIFEITAELETYEFDKQMGHYSEVSLRVFKAELAQRYNEKE